jgi:hypothetical protein
MTTITMKDNTLVPFQVALPVWPACEPTQVTLSNRGLWRLDGDHRWQVIVCLMGSVWITQENDLQDYLLRPGQGFIITRPGVVLIQGRPDAQLQLTPSLDSVPPHRRVVSLVFD